MLERERATLIVAVATLVLTAFLYIFIPKGLFPTQDTGQLQARVLATESISYARMSQLQQAVGRAILQDPDVANLSSFIGVDGANNTMLNSGQMLINLKPHRTAGSQAQIMDNLRRRASAVPGGHRVERRTPASSRLAASVPAGCLDSAGRARARARTRRLGFRSHAMPPTTAWAGPSSNRRA